MKRFYLLFTIFFILIARIYSAETSEMPEYLNSCEGIQKAIARAQDEILKRRALATFQEGEADRWYLVRLSWWLESRVAWKVAQKEEERIKLLQEEIAILKKLLKTCKHSPHEKSQETDA